MEDIRCYSGPGKNILKNISKPLLENSSQYDRVSSFYNPQSLFAILDELTKVWKRGGTIRLIIGYHQALEIIPALNDEIQIKTEIKNAVLNLLQGYIDDLLRQNNTRVQEIYPILQELIRRGGLHVRLVTPKVNVDYYKKRKKWPNPEKGIFHSKFAIFHYKNNRSDQIMNVFTNWIAEIRKRIFYYKPSTHRLIEGESFAVVTGSFNESKGGYGNNIEDAVIHRSWKTEEKEVACYFLDRFEELWIDVADDVISMPFDKEFTEIIGNINKSNGHDILGWDMFFDNIEKSPFYTPLCLPNIGLLPHQLRAYNKGLKRWPIRALLSDEVGLGKTVEAGVILYYLVKFAGVKKILILVPASLRKKWQRELKNLFDLEFWIYNPSDCTCEYDERTRYVGNNPLSKCNFVIVSWHWARLNITRKGTRFREKDLPEVLVVDEAHHARIKTSTQGGTKTTKLYDLLLYLEKRIPHILLLTATPFQTSSLDYYSLLSILGIYDDFDITGMEHFSKYTKGEIHKHTFSSKVRNIRDIHETLYSYSVNPEEENVLTIKRIPENANTEIFEEYAFENDLTDDLFLKYHLTTLLTIRSTRSSLKKQGYVFPTVHLSGADISINEEQREWFNDLEEYISKRLGKVESTITSNKNTGLLKSLYRQRVVSSIQAAVDTLNNRKRLLIKFKNSSDPNCLNDTLGEEFKSEDNDPVDKSPNIDYQIEEKKLFGTLIEKATNEIYHIDRLITNVNERFASNKKISDPKMKRLKEIINEHLKENRKILVFSRFTSTTEAIVSELHKLVDSAGLGRFDGKFVGTYMRNGDKIDLNKCSREEIILHLKSGKIKVLVCSDAASEGLDLHSANVAINVDVPWNPARLLQRFGRIDRLGQKSGDVYLTNMYYPNTIEERMYSVLENRRVDFRSLLGEVPEILSQEQRNVIRDYANNTSIRVNLTVEDIEKARQIYHNNQFKHLEFKEGSKKDIYAYLVDLIVKTHEKSSIEIAKNTYKIKERIISSDPLNNYFLSWNSKFIEEFEQKIKENGKKAKVYTVENQKGRVFGLIIKYNKKIFPLSTNEWSFLFKFIFGGSAIPIKDLTEFNPDDIAYVYRYIKENDGWIIPNHHMMKSISNIQPEYPYEENVKIGKYVGDVLIIN